MKLKSSYSAHDTGSESLLVPLGGAGWSGVVKGNRTLGAILNLLKAETTEAAIVDAMVRRYDAPEAVIAADVQKAINELRKIGALDE